MKYDIPELKKPTDGLARTEWQDPEVLPTIPGDYEAVTGGGHVFKRKFDGNTWRSAVNNEPSTVRMPWRGVAPGSIDAARYPAATRSMLILEDAVHELTNAGFREVDISESILFNP